MRTIETMQVTARGKTRLLELRAEEINSKTFLSVWFAGDETGEWKKQLEGPEERVRPEWDRAANHFGVTPVSV